ncbi:ankyrin repeat-containing protein [Dorcoceras hygrometricum]|uniref:Ankyrin repeat-containing protein n=1 Tax=Dorcoceras hygrometricum TaxID=472368 RepID=A0A2Z7B1Q1_9LAMI|nr:ankyrin repeat-containing protein [Dorcoceras hygrometricum]
MAAMKKTREGSTSTGYEISTMAAMKKTREGSTSTGYEISTMAAMKKTREGSTSTGYEISTMAAMKKTREGSTSTGYEISTMAAMKKTREGSTSTGDEISTMAAMKKTREGSTSTGDEISTVRPRHIPPADLFQDSGLYFDVKSGNLNNLRSRLDHVSDTEILSSLRGVTPSGSTLLHVAARYGHDDVVYYIASKDPSVIFLRNFIGDTALHVAVKTGNESTVKALVVIQLHHMQTHAAVENDADSSLGMTNKRGNTVLHEALISGQESIALYLIREDPILVYYTNKHEKYGLHLAIESGLANCVSSILECLTDSRCTNNLFKMESPIKMAIMNKRQDILEIILASRSNLIDLQDYEGRTPLHYAASLGYVEVIDYILERHPSGYLQRDNMGEFPIHRASAEGHVDAVILLLNKCQVDPVELLNHRGQNILHVAVERAGKLDIVLYILREPRLHELVNMGDISGNTPLHLASMYLNPYVVSALAWDQRVNAKLINNSMKTALDIAEVRMKDNSSFRSRLAWAALKAAGAPRTAIKNETEGWWSLKDYQARVDTLLLVSILVATITFAAGFTQPGGYSTSEADLGMAVMLRKTGFHVFLLCDTMAMYISLIVTATLIWAQLADLHLVMNVLSIALPLLGVAFSLMSIAFTAGIFLVCRNLHWLSATILAMGSVVLTVLLVLFAPLCVPITSSKKILRYISYYPFCLLMLATSGDQMFRTNDIRLSAPQCLRAMSDLQDRSGGSQDAGESALEGR